jgi:uridine monophosphate synthetase
LIRMTDKKEIVKELYKVDGIKFGDFTLKSGIYSPYYIQLRHLTSHPELLLKIGEVLGNAIKEKFKDVDKIIGIAYAGIPLATAISIATGIPSCYTRKEVKEHGIPHTVEGELKDGDNVVLIDDLITDGQSKFESIEGVKGTAKCDVKGIAVLFDREQGGREILAKSGLELLSIMTITEAAQWLKEDGVIPEDKYSAIVEYVKNPPKPE